MFTADPIHMGGHPDRERRHVETLPLGFGGISQAEKVFSRETHDLYGQSIIGKVLVHTTGKGGVATAWAFLDMRAQGTAPLGIIFQLANPIMAQGAALADLPLMDRLEPDPLDVIESGDWLIVDPPAGEVRVRKQR